jgi:hypothetical protein
MVKLTFIANMKKILPLFSSGNPISNGIIPGPQTRDLMKNKNFNALLKGTEKLLGKHIKYLFPILLTNLSHPTTGHYLTICLKPSGI